MDEAKKAGVMVQVHAVSSKAMMAAVDAGVPLLVHLPNKDWISKEDAKKLAASGTKVLGTVGFGTPVFGVFAEDNFARFRDGKPWPESIVDGVRLGEEAGYMPVNARTVWDAGAILGYCTDTTYDPMAGLEHELKTINPMFSMKDIIKMMGPNTASYIQMGDQLGTLEAGQTRRHHSAGRQSAGRLLEHAEDQGGAQGRRRRRRQTLTVSVGTGSLCRTRIVEPVSTFRTEPARDLFFDLRKVSFCQTK